MSVNALNTGTPVVTTEPGGDHTRIGDLKRVVVDPVSREITHMIVQKGFLFATDRVVPIDLVDSHGSDQIVLTRGFEESDFPEFVDSHFAPLATDPRNAPLVWAHPLGVGALMASPSRVRVRAETERAVPDGSAVLSEDTVVLDANSEKIGTASDFAMDDNGFITHVTVEGGWLRDDRTIPMVWAERVDGNAIHLSLTDDELRAAKSAHD